MSSRSTTRDPVAAPDRLRAATAVYELLASFIRRTPRDMSLTSLSALATLSRIGPRRITDLAASEGVAQPSVTAMVTTLERAGLVERRRDPADKRVVMVAITDAGSAYVRARREAGAQTFSQALEKLSPDEAATLAAAVPVIEHLRAIVDEQRGSAGPR
ncbi:MAG TPA: MarR family transcriptional regulator [Actinocrinis sp.]|uniref:MarR family winged helix-turn-helix transcriptional regulator n=1 Tax=Actinocrinis sp. TaxID=1920516 RepID=UPI002DDCCA0E|nr:MarR family transcriptional regulator [Actinocrinis sp.]HEV3173086.1 MarR family transcriptional regulator [Actinocrinis sp.]